MLPETEAVDPSFLKFLALKKGAKFADAKDAWEEIKRYRQVQAAAVAKRLLGQPKTWRECENCFGWGRITGYEGEEQCTKCLGSGRVHIY
jgi:hypothetical protein